MANTMTPTAAATVSGETGNERGAGDVVADGVVPVELDGSSASRTRQGAADGSMSASGAGWSARAVVRSWKGLTSCLVGGTSDRAGRLRRTISSGAYLALIGAGRVPTGPRRSRQRASRSHSTQRRAVPPAMPEASVAARREHIDAVRAPRGRGRRPGELATERLPRMPARAVPVAVPELAVVEDREDLELVHGPRGRGRRGRQRPRRATPGRARRRPAKAR